MTRFDDLTGERQPDDLPDPADCALALIDGFRPTDQGNALRLIRLADGRIRYVHLWGKWIVYSDGRWNIDFKEALIGSTRRQRPPGAVHRRRRPRREDPRRPPPLGPHLGIVPCGHGDDPPRPQLPRRPRPTHRTRPQAVAPQRAQRHHRPAHRRPPPPRPRRPPHRPGPGRLRPGRHLPRCGTPASNGGNRTRRSARSSSGPAARRSPATRWRTCSSTTAPAPTARRSSSRRSSTCSASTPSPRRRGCS